MSMTLPSEAHELNTRRWYANEIAKALWQVHHQKRSWISVAPPRQLAEGRSSETGPDGLPGVLQVEVRRERRYGVPSAKLAITRAGYHRALDELRDEGLLDAWNEWLERPKPGSVFSVVADKTNVRRSTYISEATANAALFVLESAVFRSPFDPEEDHAPA